MNSDHQTNLSITNIKQFSLIDHFQDAITALFSINNGLLILNILLSTNIISNIILIMLIFLKIKWTLGFLNIWL